MILGIIDFHSIIRIVFLKDFPLFFKIFKAFVTQKAVIYHTYHFFPLGKYLLRLTQYDIKIRIGSEPANIGMSSNGSVVILGGLSLVNSLHAYTFASLKRKKLISTTPLNDALNALILALNASAAAFVLLFTKKFRILS